MASGILEVVDDRNSSCDRETQRTTCNDIIVTNMSQHYSTQIKNKKNEAAHAQ